MGLITNAFGGLKKISHAGLCRSKCRLPIDAPGTHTLYPAQVVVRPVILKRHYTLLILPAVWYKGSLNPAAGSASEQHPLNPTETRKDRAPWGISHSGYF